MPTYEYTCKDCRKKVTLFFLSIRKAEEETPTCPGCGGSNLSRLISRFAMVRSSGSILDGGGDMPDMGDLEKGDPKTLARWMRRMSDEVGQPIEPEMEGVLNRLEAGEDPEKIESELGSETPGAPDTPDTL